MGSSAWLLPRRSSAENIRCQVVARHPLDEIQGERAPDAFGVRVGKVRGAHSPLVKGLSGPSAIASLPTHRNVLEHDKRMDEIEQTLECAQGIVLLAQHDILDAGLFAVTLSLRGHRVRHIHPDYLRHSARGRKNEPPNTAAKMESATWGEASGEIVDEEKTRSMCARHRFERTRPVPARICHDERDRFEFGCITGILYFHIY